MSSPIEELKERLRVLEDTGIDFSARTSVAASAILLAECYRRILIETNGLHGMSTEFIDQEASELFQGRGK